MLNPDNNDESPLQALIREKMTEKNTRQVRANRSENQTPPPTTWSTHAAPPPEVDEPFRPDPTQSVDALDSVYEATKWQILIDGKPILRVVSFEMVEKFSQHSLFSLRIFYGHLEEVGSYRIDNSKDLPGKKLVAILGTHLKDDHIQFTGIIT